MSQTKSPLIEIFDYKTDNRGDPVELAEWLKENRDKLDDMKILYVLKPNKDKLLKFGIAGAREGGTSAYGRLRQYLNIYGKQDVNFPCLGVNLYYIFGNKYAKDVQTTNTYVFKKEKYLKDYFKSTREEDPGLYEDRGTERIDFKHLDELINIIKDTRDLKFEDEPTKIRRSARFDQSFIQPDDRVESVTEHITPRTGTGKTYYRVNWTRPYIDPLAKRTDKNKLIYGENSPATKIKTYPNGPEALLKYQLANPNAKFRD